MRLVAINANQVAPVINKEEHINIVILLLD